MTDFAQSYAHSASLEGGYQAVPSDKGNYVAGQLIGTNRGIAAPTLAAYLGHTPTVAEMKALTAATAADIFRKNYWVPIGGDKIANQSIAELIMDFALNSGTGTAIRHVQLVLRAVGYDLVADGLAGPKTLAALNAAPQQDLFDRLKAERTIYYKNLASASAAAREWLGSWLGRLDTFLFRQPAPVHHAPVAG